MSKRATITVLPSAEHPDYLTIHDAMLQIADLFALLKGDTGDDLDWRLVSASTNSPFTAVGEMIVKGAPAPGILAAAELAADEAYQSLSDVLAGDDPGVEFDSAILKRILARNLNGIGLTKIDLTGGRPELVITPAVATAGLEAVKAPALGVTPKYVRGSLEGELIDAGRYRNHAALKLKERVRGRILWCRIPDDRQAEFAEAATLTDVWKHTRVRLRGWIKYSKSGQVSGMMAETIKMVHPRGMSGEEVVDRSFTGGRDAPTYLDLLREGDLG